MPMLVCKGAGSMEEKEGSYITISGLTKEGIELLLAALMNAQQESEHEIHTLQR